MNEQASSRSATVGSVVRRAAEPLGNRLEADLLVGHLLGRDRSWLYAHADDPVDEGTLARFDALLQQRLSGRPVAQILGEREFYGRRFAVDPAVLVPRPETELLVDLALALAPSAGAEVVDVGAGSGCIALTLAAERPDWSVTGTEYSPEALATASKNREKLELDRVRLLRGDLLDPVGDTRFDLVVSNPPYIAEGDPHLDSGDTVFEPRMALVGGPDGLALIRRLVGQAVPQLHAGGWLLIEHGHDQAAAVRSLFAGAGLERVDSRRDLAGIERVTLGRRACV